MGGRVLVVTCAACKRCGRLEHAVLVAVDDKILEIFNAVAGLGSHTCRGRTVEEKQGGLISQLFAGLQLPISKIN